MEKENGNLHDKVKNLKRKEHELKGSVEEYQRIECELFKKLEHSYRKTQEIEKKARRAEQLYYQLKKRREGELCRAEELKEKVHHLERSQKMFNRILEESERKTKEAERRAEEAERRTEEAERRTEEAERRAHAIENITELWIVKREEVELTGPEIGRGGWGTVTVGKFRGIEVAVKRMHRQIVSQHNKERFRKEMQMAANLHHPNLVQLIGATFHRDMMILMEYIPTSLEKQLEEYKYFSPNIVKYISLDVIRALNYLHLMQPDPLILAVKMCSCNLPPVPTFGKPN